MFLKEETASPRPEGQAGLGTQTDREGRDRQGQWHKGWGGPLGSGGMRSRGMSGQRTPRVRAHGLL